MLTWAGLRSQIINLGFEEETEYTSNRARFIEAVNRAASIICTVVRPIRKRYVIEQRPFNNALDAGSTFYTGTAVTYTAAGAAYWFLTDGTGNCTITDDNGSKTVEFTGRSEHRGFISGTATFTFGGEYAYTICGIAVYAAKLSDDAADIPPWQDYITYDIRELTKNGEEYTFMGFAADEPVKSDGGYEYVRDYRIEEGTKIVLAREETGTYEVWYKAYPARITADTKDTYVFELDYDVEPLLHLLAAHFIWLDDDPTKSAQYYNEYDDLKEQIIAADVARSVAAGDIKNVRGWY